MVQLSFFQRNAVIFKILSCLLIIALLFIPKWMIEDLIQERSSRYTQAIQEVSDKWGKDTVITGPILSIPYTKEVIQQVQSVDSRGITSYIPKTIITTEYYHILPETLTISTTLLPNIRSRGIFDVPVFLQKTDLQGSILLPTISISNLQYEHAFISIGLSDSKGIARVITGSIAQQGVTLESGLKSKDVLSNGVHIPVKVQPNATIPFHLTLELRGTRSAKFLPVGKITHLSIASSWVNPSFDGAFLPKSRSLTATGFTANWEVLNYNRDFPQHWAGSQFQMNYIPETQEYTMNQAWNQHGNMAAQVKSASYEDGGGYPGGSFSPTNIGISAFGVNLLLGVDNYDKVQRSIKYAILIIGLSFLAYFLIEIVLRSPIHPIQYILIGFALCVFFTLLLSFSEQLSFNLAYFISSIATILVVSLYSRSLFSDSKFAWAIFSILICIYGFIFVTLQSEDYALLIGSIGIFCITSLIMYTTRKIDWYHAGVQISKNTAHEEDSRA